MKDKKMSSLIFSIILTFPDWSPVLMRRFCAYQFMLRNFIMCDIFLTKYINSKSQTLKLFDRACSTPSLNLGCMKTVFTRDKIKISVKIRSGIFPNVLLRINMLLDCSHVIYLQETGFSTAALWRCLASLSSNKDIRHMKKR